jgi:hypothetical protein
LILVGTLEVRFVQAGFPGDGNGYNRHMLSRLELLIDLLHSASDAALATHSTTLEGFPLSARMCHYPLLILSTHWGRSAFSISAD